MDPSHKAWECLTVDEVRRLHAVDPAKGLHHTEISRRKELYGKNALVASKERTLFDTVFSQLKSPLVFILLIAGSVTLYLGEYIDTFVIFVTVFINVLIGSLQEERANKAFQKLNASQERRAVVFRDGKQLNILAEDLVLGDVVLLQGGYFVPADIRLVEEKDLRINEATLTGEWLAVSKISDKLPTGLPLAEKENMAWMGTLIESGYGRGIVVATGSQTEIGKIALSLGTIDEQVTPLQKNIRGLSRFLSYVVAITLTIIFFVGIVTGKELHDMFLIAIATAVSTIPSGLPAAVTVVLAIGMESILKRGGLVKNLLAAETLGATTVILTDKTGTLTESKMRLTGLFSYTGIRDKKTTPVEDNRFLLELAVLESDAFIEEDVDAPAKLVVHGRPIEKAVLLSGLEAGVSQGKLFEVYERIDYLQFTSVRRFGASLHTNPKKKTNRLIIAGEPEKLLEASRFVRIDGKRVPATIKEKRRLLQTLEEHAKEGKRLIAITYRDASYTEIPESKEDERTILKDIIFAGFLSFEDPIRTDVKEAIEKVQGAGAHVIMLTGDNAGTAHHIANVVGITKPGDELVMQGVDIDDLTDRELYTKLQTYRVISRATPAHKLRIVNTLKENDEVVAMTGDGINDAPALRAASIGVAVGSGTEVAKESSDLILINNSFSIIVSAIEEGRRIIDNLKKIVAYLLSTSFSEIIVITTSLLVGGPLPLLPAQILWAKIVEEGLMSFSFAFEGNDPHAMKRDPRSARAKRIITPELRMLVFVVSTVTGVILIAIYLVLYPRIPVEELRTVMFAALSLDAIFFTFSLKSLDTPIWRIKFFSNKYLLFALFMSILLLFLALTWPPLMALLSTTPLTNFEKILLVGVGLSNLATIEAVKYFVFGRKFKQASQK